MLILLTNTKSTAKKRLAFWSMQGWPAGQIALRFECSQSFRIFKVKCIKSKGAKVSHLNALRAFEAAADTKASAQRRLNWTLRPQPSAN
jgi:hypothetical protein